MGTHIFSGGNGIVSQIASAWTFDPGANVKLKTKGKPGADWHKNASGSLMIALGTIKEHGTQVINQYGAMDTGLHNPATVLVGLFTNVANKVNRYQTFVQTVTQEAGKMVVNGVVTITNAILMELSEKMGNSIKNGKDILGGMTAQHLLGATEEEIAQLMEMLKDPSTYGGIAVSMAATAVQGVPVLGQLAGGAVAVDRIVGIGQSAMNSATELKDIMGTWGDKMTETQKEEARKRLAKWIVGGGASLLAALAGKKWKQSKKSTEVKNDKTNTDQHSDTKGGGKDKCSQCAISFPVIISSGEKLMDETDFSLPGPIPINWRRRYRSGHMEPSPWGQGWTHPFTLELRLGAEGLVHINDQGRSIELPHVQVGQTHFDKFEKFTLHHPNDNSWVIEHKGGLCHHYRRASPEQWRLQLFGISDRQGNTVRLQWAAPDAQQDAAAARTWSARQYGSTQAETPPPLDPFAIARLVGVIDSAGRELRLRWANVTEVGTQSAPQGSPDSARLVAVDLMAQGQAYPLVTYQYDTQGQLTATHHAGQPYRQYAWRSGVLVGYRKASGHRYFAQYDSEGPQGRVLRSWCADAPVPGQDDDHFQYHPLQRVTLHRDGLNRITRYHWDERFNITATVVAAGTVDETRIQTPFDASGNPSGSVDALGRRTTFRYDARGNLTQLTNALGHSTELAYNQLDLLVSLKDALGHEWTREYDERGNMVRLTDPLAQSTAYAYNERGWPTEVVDAKGGKKSLQWDDAGNLTAYTDCSRQTTRFEYNLLGQLTTRQDALGHTTQYRYDTAGRLIEVVEPGVNKNSDKGSANDGKAVIQHAIHQYTWNGEGQLLAYTDPLGGSTRYTYDGDGRPLTRTDAAGRSLVYRYDAAGRSTTLVNENSAQTQFRYNLLDHLTDEIGFDGRHQRYCYNAAGELTHLIETGGSDLGPGKVTHFERDALGSLLAKRSFDSSTSAETAYTYDSLGRLTSARNGAAHLAFVYDPLGQLLGETQTLVGLGGTIKGGKKADVKRSLAHQYDPLGNRTQTTLPDGRTLNWLFYGSGHLHQINLAEPDVSGQAPLPHQVLADIERDALHREVSRSQGQLSSRFDYDPAGRLTRHRAAHVGSGNAVNARGAVVERAYAYDAAGQLVARADSLRGRQDFRYDPTGRILAAMPSALVGASGAGSISTYNAELFAFDPAGNLLPEKTSAHDGTSAGSADDGVIFDNRLRFYQDLAFEYDEHGNVTRRVRGNQSAGTHSDTILSWNADHQLTQAKVTRHGVTQTTSYAYDALGRRVAKLDAFGSTHYLWDGDLMIHSQRGNKEALFVFEPNSFVPLATVQGISKDQSSQQTYWYQCDQIGAPQELTDKQGSIVWAADYKVWGEAKLRAIDWQRTGTDGGFARGPGVSAGVGGNWGSSGSSSKAIAPPIIEQPFRFQGQQFDEETGLHYNRFRYYDPAVGRFVSEDPIGLHGGLNLFSYSQNPLVWIDPRGLAGSPTTATHITYTGMKDGKPYVGYASMQGCHTPEDVLKYRYGNDFSVFDNGKAPTAIYAGHGQEGKDTARGLEQKTFEDMGGIDKDGKIDKTKTSNKQNPVGKNNKRRNEYTAAAGKHCPCEKPTKPKC